MWNLALTTLVRNDTAKLQKQREREWDAALLLLKYLITEGNKTNTFFSNWGIYIVSLFTVLWRAEVDLDLTELEEGENLEISLLAEIFHTEIALLTRECFAIRSVIKFYVSQIFIAVGIIVLCGFILRHLHWQRFLLGEIYSHHLVYYLRSRSHIAENHLENYVFRFLLVYLACHDWVEGIIVSIKNCHNDGPIW